VNRSQAASKKNRVLEDQTRNLTLAKETAQVEEIPSLSDESLCRTFTKVAKGLYDSLRFFRL
jgi:hypothetical protein